MERAFAEIAGRATGFCKGKGGTMHVADLSLGFLGAISIVGGGMPIAAGSGLAAQVRGSGQVTACFFGDGAANHGNFGEGLNVAAIWKLPVIFVCENNQWNEYTPTGKVTAGPNIAARAAGYDMPGLVVERTYRMALTMDQVVNFGAKIRYMTGGQATVPAVVRAPGGITAASAATHSQSLEAWFYHVPGLKMVMPSTPADAKGLLKTAIRDDNLVIFLEVKSLYNTRGPVPTGEHLISLGRAEVKRPGRDVTVIATGAMVPLALEAGARVAGARVAADGIEIEVIDPRSLVPLDMEAILASVRKTNRAITFEEAVLRGSVGADIAATIMREAFDDLDGPVVRVEAPPVPVPFSPALEGSIRPTADRLIAAVRSVLGK